MSEPIKEPDHHFEARLVDEVSGEVIASISAYSLESLEEQLHKLANAEEMFNEGQQEEASSQ
jgi:hypothetical protein